MVAEITRNKQDAASIEREYVKFSKELRGFHNLSNKLIEETDNLQKRREYLESMEQTERDELSMLKKQLDIEKDNYEKEGKTRGDMEMKIKKMKNQIYAKDEEFIMLESKGKKLQNQVKGYQIESIKLNKQIKILQKQQEKYGIEASTAHAHYYQTVEELKIKNNIIAELQKKSLELESKLKHQ